MSIRKLLIFWVLCVFIVRTSSGQIRSTRVIRNDQLKSEAIRNDQPQTMKAAVRTEAIMTPVHVKAIQGVSSDTTRHVMMLGGAKNKVTLYNTENKAVKILMGESKQALAVYEIGQKEKWVSPTYANDPMVVLTTNGKAMTYAVKLKGTYWIIWDAKNGYWAVQTLNMK